MEKIEVFIDGGSRGNPGPAAFGVVLVLGDGAKKKYNQFIGKATNNEAEYQGLIFGFKKIKSLLGKSGISNVILEIKSDSELLVKQMRGEYKILDQKIQPLFLQAWNLKIGLKKVEFLLVPREQNREADSLVNEALDAEAAAQKLFQ